MPPACEGKLFSEPVWIWVGKIQLSFWYFSAYLNLYLPMVFFISSEPTQAVTTVAPTGRFMLYSNIISGYFRVDLGPPGGRNRNLHHRNTFCRQRISDLYDILQSTALPTLEPCDLSLDLFFVLDGSGSVSVSDFDMVKQFVVAVVSTFTISLTDTRVGVLQYSDGSTWVFFFSQHALFATRNPKDF